jgi:hypothetical protein
MKCLYVAIACCAAFAHAADAPSTTPFTKSLEPKAMHEECVKLAAGDKRKYYWKSSAPVDFNIHYHEGNDVSFPVKRDGMRGDGGVFTAKVAQDYCWMWTARDKAAKLEGKIEK